MWLGLLSGRDAPQRSHLIAFSIDSLCSAVGRDAVVKGWGGRGRLRRGTGVIWYHLPILSGWVQGLTRFDLLKRMLCLYLWGFSPGYSTLEKIDFVVEIIMFQWLCEHNDTAQTQWHGSVSAHCVEIVTNRFWFPWTSDVSLTTTSLHLCHAALPVRRQCWCSVPHKQIPGKYQNRSTPFVNLQDWFCLVERQHQKRWVLFTGCHAWDDLTGVIWRLVGLFHPFTLCFVAL